MAPKKSPMTVTYAKPGTQPPVYLAGSFSEPEWHPEEMEFTTEGTEHQFHKKILAEEGGSFQYKFRIGNGDWWVLNEEAPTVTDDVGNRNNLLTVPVTKAPRETKEPYSEEIEIHSPQPDHPIPALVLEKVDSSPSHGEDFGTDASVDQKDAHDNRALDAEPDFVVVRSEASTPLYANTAAEVADSAALIDKEDPTPPISDEEAGRTGQRRMSFTPISQVAETAAEVADSAAKLDLSSITQKRLDLPSFKFLSNSVEPNSGTVTPWNERVPLFDHELPEPYDGVPKEPTSPETYHNNHSGSVYDDDEEAIRDDPTLEEFPCDRESIIARVRTTSTRLSPDEVRFGDEESSPLFTARQNGSSLPPPSPVLLSHQPSPNLGVIAEEHPETEDEFTLPQAGVSNSNTAQDLSAVSEAPEIAVVAAEVAPLHEEPVKEAPVEEDPVVESATEAVKEHPVVESVTEAVKEHPVVETATEPVKEEPAGPSAKELVYDEPVKKETEEEEPVKADPVSEGVDVEEIEHVYEIPTIIAPVAMAAAVSVSKDLPTSCETETKDTISASEPVEAPEIPFIPAVPADILRSKAAAADTEESIPEVSAKSTAIFTEDESNERSGLKKRSAPPISEPPVERASTPVSIRSSTKDKKNPGLLITIWRTIFVGWIGGLLSRLFGGGKESLITLAILFTIVPALYFSRLI